MRKANVMLREIVAGQLIEDADGYTFAYSDDYLQKSDAEPERYKETVAKNNAKII